MQCTTHYSPSLVANLGNLTQREGPPTYFPPVGGGHVNANDTVISIVREICMYSILRGKKKDIFGRLCNNHGQTVLSSFAVIVHLSVINLRHQRTAEIHTLHKYGSVVREVRELRHCTSVPELTLQANFSKLDIIKANLLSES